MAVILRKNWRFFVAVLAPIILTLIPLTWNSGITGKEPYAAYVISLMGIYWMTECIPIPVTSFIPITLFPLFGILASDRVTSVYLQDSLLFLLGGCIFALSFEYSNLHSRIALTVIMFMGARISQLLFGIVATTMTLSMWMNNTSTTAMMVPIVNALVEELRIKMLENIGDTKTSTTSDELPMETLSSSLTEEFIEKTSPDESVLKKKLNDVELKIQNLRIMFLLGTAFSSNIGGTGVITGSSTNLIALDLVRKDSEETYTPESCRNILEISFLNWMVFNFPPMILNTLFCYLYLQIHFMGIPSRLKFWQKETETDALDSINVKSLEKSIKKAIGDKYRSLGPVCLHEMAVLGFFFVMVSLWIFKDPRFIPGWDSFFPKSVRGKSFVKEATPTLLIAFLLFVFPSKSLYFKNFKKGGLGKGVKDPLLHWTFVQKNFPWGIFMLLGGGASMALAAKESGLNAWFEKILASNEALKTLPNWILLLIILFLISILTTVASNTAVAAIVTPVLLGMAYIKDIHPLYLVFPATTACSYAFILPVSTPPNAIVYSASPHVKLTDMMVPGFIINIASIAILLLTTQTTATWSLGFDDYRNECQNMTQLG